MKSLGISLLLIFSSWTAVAFQQPVAQFTPGKLCSETDPNFKEYRYPAHVAVCNRNVSDIEKAIVAKNYGVPREDWPKYEFDHLIPLNAGGSDDASNIWPQPLTEAKLKDVVEQATFDGLSRGTLTQEQAVKMIWDWFASEAARAETGSSVPVTPMPPEDAVPETAPVTAD